MLGVGVWNTNHVYVLLDWRFIITMATENSNTGGTQKERRGNTVQLREKVSAPVIIINYSIRFPFTH